jgi:hypothetical protein
LLNIAPDVSWVLAFVIEFGFSILTTDNRGNPFTAKSMLQFNELSNSYAVEIKDPWPLSFNEVTDDVVVIRIA